MVGLESSAGVDVVGAVVGSVCVGEDVVVSSEAAAAAAEADSMTL